ncbi:OmpW/AlkL family protein [Ichthyenterobacterium magnum]|uniref:Outer membrane protein n=1 Tax=Ichthyenterobacterium magnum TaxID=1230530 RepID=A0A420DLJ4_9FLAO|nr:OmpW family outer membrane protein [Ichthyenterobacterium magnum]RKE95113.1 outer membrane protein [Ichthyenterobacterium magnum]
MKKTIFTALMLSLFTFVNAQNVDTKETTDYSKWQARFRIVSVIPSPGDDIVGADVDISTAYVPEFDLTYFFNKNLAAELILATTKHDVEIENGADLGHVWLLPPTLNLQYHFYANEFKPYVGAGINYTIFYGVDSGDVNDIDYDSSVGFSLQAGVDYNLNDKWFLNLDIKKILLKTDVTVNNASTSSEVEINPLLVGVGVGLKF